MKFHLHWLDVSVNLAAGLQPVFMVERPLAHGEDRRGGVFAAAEVGRLGDFWVPKSPVVGVDEVSWAVTRHGELVRVPVTAYRTPTRAASSILATGLELGFAALAALTATQTKAVPTDVHLVIGHECTDLQPEDAFRCYVGIAIVT